MNALDRYLIKAPEIIFEWKDPESEAIGWVVINSLKGGAAGGGTRMRKGLTKTEVVELAKTMEVKFNVCGPGIGGAKSGINFDPNDPRKKEVLSRWFKVISPLLKTYYGTAGDLNVDERLEVSPMLQEIGIMHPQQGVLTGHYALNAEKSALRLNRLKQGTSLLLTNPNFAPVKAGSPYSTADMITGFGVYSAIKAYYQQLSSTGVKDKRFFIQGWGNVGAAAGWYLAKDGGKIVLIQDRNSYYLNEKGASFEDIDKLLMERTGNTLAPGTSIEGQLSTSQIESLKIDAFIPAAASRLVTRELSNGLLRQGLELMVCGANVAFDEEEIIYGSLSRELDEKVAIIPDFIANCGVARLFSYLLSGEGSIEENAIFNDVDQIISKAVCRITNDGQKSNFLIQNALDLYL